MTAEDKCLRKSCKGKGFFFLLSKKGRKAMGKYIYIYLFILPGLPFFLGPSPASLVYSFEKGKMFTKKSKSGNVLERNPFGGQDIRKH